MDSDRSQFPCMPTPIMPKRTRSLGGTASGASMRLRGSDTIGFAANDAPAAAALKPRNSRREQWLCVMSSELNTIHEFGDFDGDGLLDLAVQIKDTGGLRHGIAIVHRIDRSVHVVGAGQPIGNGKDQLNWRASWGVDSPRHVRGHAPVG